MEPNDVTRHLRAWQEGSKTARNEVARLIYDDLRRVARHQLSKERAGHTLQPTALVNEGLLRLLGSDPIDWRDRKHFFAVAARTMRRVLIDLARQKQAAKRGGERVEVTLDEMPDDKAGVPVDVLALNQALEELEHLAPRQVRLVELRYFAGLTIRETAEALGISPATVKSDWAMARTWLHSRLRQETRNAPAA